MVAITIAPSVYTRVNVYYKGQPWEYDDRSPVLTLFKNTVKSWLLYKEYILIEYIMIDLDLSKDVINSV